jgi:hypothetical protein
MQANSVALAATVRRRRTDMLHLLRSRMEVVGERRVKSVARYVRLLPAESATQKRALIGQMRAISASFELDGEAPSAARCPGLGSHAVED